jgi:hypothetical protein
MRGCASIASIEAVWLGGNSSITFSSTQFSASGLSTNLTIFSSGEPIVAKQPPHELKHEATQM